ncbi:E3 ubiquitin-protein ligase UBR1 [Candida viswanathii]|uniref:E3 ubiquitin-protein ligase n=1 Tax=Candida viswanathii TaxID=5486 RepID=A0A367YAM9_9ASCO|nr:E3 ubiquitin-protein ligase UBR1 [Candida viswanathii]
MNPDSLKRFLVEVPLKLHFKDSTGIQHYIFKVLYYSATNDGEYLQTLFPNISTDDAYDITTIYDVPIETEQTRPFYKQVKAEYTHARDKACARPFAAGERVYHCLDCGFDDTCVLCSYCFNEKDHLSHNVTSYQSRGTSGGICDCGDTEAFVNTLHCKCQVDDEEGEELNDTLESLQKTMAIALDYVLDVTNYSLLTLPFIHTELCKGYPAVNLEQLSDYSSLPKESYGGAEDINSTDKWYLVLWNDEFHNLTQAMNAIKDGTGVNEARAQQIARKIDHDGYCVLKESTTPRALARSKKLVESNGLVATIVSARDFLREKVCVAILNWFNDVLNSHSLKISKFSQTYFAELLLDSSFEFSNVLPAKLLLAAFRVSSDDEKRTYFENGIPYEGKLVNLNYHELKQPVESLNLYESISDLMNSKIQLDDLKGSRLQLLLAFQIRFPKRIRKSLGSLLVPYLVKTPELKQEFADQVVELYPTLLSMYALTDREEDLNLLNDIASQLFTCPQTVRTILENGKVDNILGPLAKLVEEHSSKYDPSKGYGVYSESYPKSQQRRRLRKAISHSFKSLTHFFYPAVSGDSMVNFLKPNTIRLLILLLRNFQGFAPLVRKYGDHVEMDIVDLSIYWDFTLPILSSMKNLAVAMWDQPEVDNATIKLLDFLIKQPKTETQPGVLQFQVSKEPVGFVNPLNTLLSFFLEFRDIQTFQPLLEAYKSDLVAITDVSLRSIVLGSQVLTGFWIRNGAVASRQATLYFGAFLPEFTFIRDFHLNQVAVLFEDPEKVLMNFLERWELYSWFKNEVKFDRTIYEERFFPIVERFISFAYNLFVDRSLLIKESPQEAALKKLKRSIAYALCEEAMAYTPLRDKLDSDVKKLDEFDDILFEVADYQPPSALVDTGLYRLKGSLYKNLDPLSILLDPGDFQVISEVLLKNTKKKRDEPKVLTPVIIESGVESIDKRIGDFAKTLQFVKLIYKFLQVAIDTSNETYLPHLLHLIHAIILDDEKIHGKQYLNENFVDIPVTDLLLTIVESKMSKQVCEKADFLVDQLVSKDKRIVDSLVDCFGEEYMQTYKKRKTNLFESEANRKKRQAEERNNKVLKKFLKQQEKFLNQNKDLTFEAAGNEKVSAGDDTKNLRTCVACGELESFEKPLGIMVSNTKAPIFWKLPPLAGEALSAAYKEWDKDLLLHSNADDYGIGYDTGDAPPTYGNDFEARVLSTCGHSIHYECVARRTLGISQYPCPLCHNLHESFIPSFMGNLDVEVPRDILFGPTEHVKYNQIVQGANSNSKRTRLLEVFVKLEHFSEASRVLHGVVETAGTALLRKKYLFPGSGPNDSKFNRLMDLGNLLADTIRMNEIATRLNGAEGYTDFLSQIPGSTKTLLISIIQLRLIHEGKTFSRTLEGNAVDFSREVCQFWDANTLLDSVFNEVVVLFFQTDESLSTLAKWGMAKTVSIAVYSMLNRYEHDEEYFKSIQSGLGETDSADDETVEAFYQFLSNVLFANDRHVRKFNKEMSVLLYYAIERILGVFLRQVIIFQDALTIKQQAENTYESIPELAQLGEKIELQTRLSDTKALTDVLQIPSYNELILNLLRSADSLETNVFDILWNAKIPKHMNQKILSLDYPGMVHLTSLPLDYSASIMKAPLSVSRENFKCLVCGAWIKERGTMSHMMMCASQTGIFFSPSTNGFKVYVYIGHSPIGIRLPAPYLTKHGEVKTRSYKGKATMNEFRFAYLNKLWVTQGLYAFVTRNLFGSGIELGGINVNFDADDVEAEEEEEEEDDVFVQFGPDDEIDDDNFMIM